MQNSAKYLRTCEVLGILGATQTVVGIVIIVIAYDISISWTVGALIIANGVLGIYCGKKTASSCTFNTHMGFSIACSFAAGIDGVLSAMSLYHYWTSYQNGQMPGSLNDALLGTILAFGTVGLSIASAVLCVQATSAAGLGACCGGCCNKQPLHQQQCQKQNDVENQPMVYVAPASVQNSGEKQF